MSVKFGTSGLRGLVSAMTPELVTSHVRAFLAACDTSGSVYIGRDLRPSSPRIAGEVMDAVRDAGIDVIDCGAVPTPALALAAGAAGAGAIMVTGSHIPADRNGLKLYSSSGEITKDDEAAILAHLETPAQTSGLQGSLRHDPEAASAYVARYVDAYGPAALRGQRVGLYAHSAVGRDLLADILTGLGATVITLGRTETFVPVDTEAINPEARAQIKNWVITHDLDALVSTDGDSDRPLLADETGEVIPGDLLGQITAQSLDAEVVVTPISSNSGVQKKGFSNVQLTRIGSPFVIAAMQSATGKVVGYEANGGFLLGFQAQGPTGAFLDALMTRDCTLPILAVLFAGRNGGVSARVSQEPAITTLADRLPDIASERSLALLKSWQQHPSERRAFLDTLGRTEAQMDLTDGMRIIATNGDVIHVRPSGNAPELRLYVEARDTHTARDLQARVIAFLAEILAK